MRSADRLLDQLHGPASSFEKIEAILTCPITYALADAIPDKPHAGRPRDYPKYMWVVYHALVNHVWASARRVEAEIGHEEVWRFIRRIVRSQFPDDPGMWLPARPMRRWHYTHACTYLRDPDILQAMKAVQREKVCKLALELGLFGEEGAVSWTHPEPDRFMQADGKVMTPLYKGRRRQRVVDQEIGEVRSVRFDPDAKLHIEGGGNAALGNKYVIVSARNEDERLLLDIEYDSGQKGDGGEAAAAMRCFERLAPILPRAQGVNYDKAMRGVHIEEAARKFGWIINTGVHALKDADGQLPRSVGPVLAALIGFLGDFDLAEEADQEAFVIAAKRQGRRPGVRSPSCARAGQGVCSGARIRRRTLCPSIFGGDPMSTHLNGRAIPSARTMSRRGFMILSAKTGALAATGGLLAACTSNSNPSGGNSDGGGGVQISEHVPGPQPVSGGKYGGNMRVVFEDSPDSFDAPLGGGITLIGWDVVTEVVYFGSMLAYDGASGGPAPNIAASMPDVSSDGKTLTFTLRPDVKFHNGRVITADDFKWSWERMLDPTLKSWGASYLSNVVGYQDVREQKTKTLEGVEVVSPTTLKLTLAQPDFTILNAMSLPITAPVPKEEVERLGDTKFGQTPVGFGPFKIDSYDEANQRAVFVKFDDYMYPGLPYVDSVEYHWGVDPSLQMLQLQHGDVDLVGDGVPANQVAATLADPELEQFVRPFSSPGDRWVTLFENHPPLDDIRVRQALNWAVDRDALDRVIRDATGFGSPFPENLGDDFPRVFQPYTLDTAKAKQLLSEAGFANGVTLTLTFAGSTPEPEIAQVLQQQLQEVGVTVELNQVSYGAKFALEAKQEPEMTTDQWYLVQPTPADIVDAVYISGGSSNYNLYSNPQVDTLAKEALGEFDEKTRNEKYAQIEKLIGDDAPGIFLQSLKWNAAVSPNVQNYQYRGDTYSYYDRLWF